MWDVSLYGLKLVIAALALALVYSFRQLLHGVEFYNNVVSSSMLPCYVMFVTYQASVKQDQ